MRKWISRAAAVLSAAVLSVSCLAACGGSGSTGSADANSPTETNAAAPAADATGAEVPAADSGEAEALQIVTTIFPEYDWIRVILGEAADGADITLLLDNGVDLHSYQPTAADIMKISTCDLFIYVGGESDKWVDDALAEAINPDMQIIDLLDVLGDAVREEEVVEGMQGEEEEGEEDEEEGPEYDEHVWLSLRNAQVICGAICEALSEADPEHADTYAANTAAYTEQLSALDAAYADLAENAARNTLLFADRFPFRYLTEDYGLEYYAAFVGCSAETEASFETIRFLSEKVDEFSLPSILILDGGDGRIARTIADTADAEDIQILQIDSMQSTTSVDIANGATYLSIMQDNLDVLTEALN